MGIKLTSYMRIHSSLGHLELLVVQCIKDCVPFMLFFFTWNYMFARFFAILGIDSETDEFSGLFVLGRYFMGVYENSLGNISTPNYTIWNPAEPENKNFFNRIILVIIWVIWFMNQWFIFMILLNFVIALIS